jgi:hypothetical protein
MREPHTRDVGQTEVVNQVARLLVIPPPQEFDGNTSAFQSGFRLFDLNLKAAVAEKKWLRVIEQDSHASSGKNGR